MLKLTMKTPQQRQWRRFGVFIVNVEHISHLFLVFLFLILSMYFFVGPIVKNHFSAIVVHTREKEI